MLAGHLDEKTSEPNTLVVCEYHEGKKQCVDYVIKKREDGTYAMDASDSNSTYYDSISRLFRYFLMPDQIVVHKSLALSAFTELYNEVVAQFADVPVVVITADTTGPSVRRALMHDTGDGLQIDAMDEGFRQYPEARLALRYHLGVNSKR